MSTDRYAKHGELLKNIKSRLPELEELLTKVNSHWTYEDLIYRYYHHSFKVYYIQGYTEEITKLLKSLAPDLTWIKEEQEQWDKRKEELKEKGKEPYFRRPTEFDFSYEDIYAKGTGKTFNLNHNSDWDTHTLPMLQAFFHAKFMLEMAVKYGKELETDPQSLPSGWAALLYFYNLR